MDFYERFYNLSNSKLVYIIEHPEEYQPKAVEAAKKIIDSRNLTHEDLDRISQEFEEERLITEQKKIAQKEHITSIVNWSNDFVKKLTPYSNKKASPDKIINFLSLILVIIIAFSAFKEISLFLSLCTYPGFEFSNLLLHIPFLFLVTSVYYFFKRQSIGWFLLTFYSVYNISFGAIGLIQFRSSILTPAIVPQTSIFTLTYSLIFWSSILITLSNKKIIERFGISSMSRFHTIAWSFIIFSTLVYLFF